MKTNPTHEARAILSRAPLPPSAARVTRQTNERMSAALANYKTGAISIRTLGQVTEACETIFKSVNQKL